VARFVVFEWRAMVRSVAVDDFSWYRLLYYNTLVTKILAITQQEICSSTIPSCASYGNPH
jgi:hypothetical protein